MILYKIYSSKEDAFEDVPVLETLDESLAKKCEAYGCTIVKVHDGR